MANPTPLTGGTNVLVTEQYNLGTAGWSESWIINVNDETTPLEAARALHEPMLVERQKVRPTQSVLVQVRYSRIDVNGDAIISTGGAGGTGQGNKIGTPGNPNTGWTMRMQDVSGQVRDIHLFRGWLQLSIDYETGHIGRTVDRTAEQFMQRVANLIRGLNTDDSIGGRYVMRSFARPGSLGAVVGDAFTFSLDDNGRVKFRALATPVLGISIGDTVKLHVQRKRCVRGLSGEYRVINKLPASELVDEYTIDKKFCCAADDLAGITGKVMKKVVAYYRIGRATLGKLLSRKTGRPFGYSPGRRPSKCC